MRHTPMLKLAFDWQSYDYKDYVADSAGDQIASLLGGGGGATVGAMAGKKLLGAPSFGYTEMHNLLERLTPDLGAAKPNFVSMLSKLPKRTMIGSGIGGAIGGTAGFTLMDYLNSRASNAERFNKGKYGPVEYGKDKLRSLPYTAGGGAIGAVAGGPLGFLLGGPVGALVGAGAGGLAGTSLLDYFRQRAVSARNSDNLTIPGRLNYRLHNMRKESTSRLKMASAILSDMWRGPSMDQDLQNGALRGSGLGGLLGMALSAAKDTPSLTGPSETEIINFLKSKGRDVSQGYKHIPLWQDHILPLKSTYADKWLKLLNRGLLGAGLGVGAGLGYGYLKNKDMI